MLVLERKNRQKIVINTSDGLIEVNVNIVDENKVKLGIQAPHNVSIWRAEISPGINVRPVKRA